MTVRSAGIRLKGSHGSYSSLDEKPSFSLKLDEFVSGQEYDGLDRLLLNNAIQDESLLNEHLAYELHRRAGVPALRTSHALVTFNGRTVGFYVVREAYDRTFLRSAFKNPTGNLYEGRCCFDFAGSLGIGAEALDLKGSGKDDRVNHHDLEAFIRVVNTTPDVIFEERLEEILDVDAYLTTYALDATLASWDGFSLNLNNYYLYRRPLEDGSSFFRTEWISCSTDSSSTH